MTKKSTYFSILVAAVIIAVAGVLLNIRPIVQVLDTMRDMVNEWPIWVLAVVCGIVFTKSKHYWLSILACAVVVTLGAQIYFSGSMSNLDLYRACVRGFGFLGIVFIVDYIRFIFKI